jgi:predicted DNA-binding transcriptional regulator YafY
MFRPWLPEHGSEVAHNAAMVSAPLLTRLERLDALAALLADGMSHAVANLAQSLHVSERTLARDLELLRRRGWLIESASGHGGGVRLPRDALPASALVLREEQALELLLALAASEALGLSLSTGLAGVRAQLARAFAPADRARIRALRQRIRVCTPASDPVRHTQRPERPRVRHLVHTAFVRHRRLAITYRAVDGRTSRRRIESHVLLLAWPFWYVLAWDLEREAVRTFRLDRIEQADLLEEPFRPRPLQPFWDHCEGAGFTL